MNSKCVRTGLFQTNCYVVEDNSASEPFVAVIDPGDDLDLIEAALDTAPSHIILTHTHFDHVGALMALHTKYPSAKIALGEHENMNPEQVLQEARYVLGSSFFMAGLKESDFNLPKPDLLLKDGDSIGPYTVLFTPGHSTGSICLYSEQHHVLYSGDTLFAHSYGRTDINGSQSLIIQSVRRLLALDPTTVVYPGHEEATTIEAERSFFKNYLS